MLLSINICPPHLSLTQSIYVCVFIYLSRFLNITLISFSLCLNLIQLSSPNVSDLPSIQYDSHPWYMHITQQLYYFPFALSASPFVIFSFCSHPLSFFISLPLTLVSPSLRIPSINIVWLRYGIHLTFSSKSVWKVSLIDAIITAWYLFRVANFFSGCFI